MGSDGPSFETKKQNIRNKAQFINPPQEAEILLLQSAEILYENKSSKQQLSKNKTKKVKRNRKKWLIIMHHYLQIFFLGCMILTFHTAQENCIMSYKFGHSWQLKKIKILGIVLELPAKRHCQLNIHCKNGPNGLKLAMLFSWQLQIGPRILNF